MVATEQDRRELLDCCMALAPTLQLNGDTYHVAVDFGAYHVIFYAVHATKGTVGTMALVTYEAWQQVDDGTLMALLYDTVLKNIEASLLQGYECGDVITWKEAAWKLATVKSLSS